MFHNNLFAGLSKYGLAACLCFSAGAAMALPISYGSATHQTQAWQQLATYDGENEIDQLGTFWSTDGGTTWGRQELFVGQSVQFKFNVHKNNVGTHYADFLKAWLDLNQDGQFDEADSIAYSERPLLITEEGNIGSWNKPNVANFSVLTDAILLTEEFIGELALRVRVVCSESLVASVGGSWGDQWNPAYQSQYESIFKPTGDYHQGEVEEWILKVSEVPESSALILMGLVLFGLGAGAARRQK